LIYSHAGNPGATQMQQYTFALRADEALIEDESGTWFDDRGRACNYARDVAQELMRGREQETRSWCLEVYEDGVRVHELLFASIDPTLDNLRSPLRETVEEGSGKRRAFRDALTAVKETLRESRALVAQSRGKPYLATFAGKPTVRPNNKKPARKSGGGGNED
jgi:hypothetical protein